ncbi:MAG: hypothetical protein C0594_04530 [Marinilabiliales bacterium]|nr:MAG: hypothetical protein C0594_04530 [Marinilabiliales bacterium]
MMKYIFSHLWKISFFLSGAVFFSVWGACTAGILRLQNLLGIENHPHSFSTIINMIIGFVAGLVISNINFLIARQFKNPHTYKSMTMLYILLSILILSITYIGVNKYNWW